MRRLKIQLSLQRYMNTPNAGEAQALPGIAWG